MASSGVICDWRQADNLAVNLTLGRSPFPAAPVSFRPMPAAKDTSRHPYGDTPPEATTRIRDVRKAQRLTMDQLAARLGVSAQAVQRWETSTRAISVDRLVQIADALGVPAAELLPDTPRLSRDEQDLLDWFRQASPAERSAIGALKHGFNERRKPETFEVRKPR